MWRYAVADLAAVKTGTMQPWEPQPVVWEMDSQGWTVGAGQAGGMALDLANRRLYCTFKHAGPAGNPVIFGYQLPAL
jgi:hypothetical protein